jgi:hypothetical protein
LVGSRKGPESITVPVGRLASVPLSVDADECDYVILGSDCDGLREYDPAPKKLRIRVIGYAPGTAYVVVTSQKGGKLEAPFVVKVTFEGKPVPPPDPPTPNPTPTPTQPPRRSKPHGWC